MSAALLLLAILVVKVVSQDMAVLFGPNIDLPIANSIIAPDGNERTAVLAGGTFPGPVLFNILGDPLTVNVHNQLSDLYMMAGTSIHFHGLAQYTSAWADGAAFVTQCPITPGSSFAYSMNPMQGGTYWYHSGYSTQSCDGLKGPMIIYDSNDPYSSMYSYDGPDWVISLSDWYHTPTAQIQTFSPPFAYPDATLINGLGRSWTNTKNTDLAVVSVNPGESHRLRIVSLSCQPAFNFSVDGHGLTIIEVDGQLHKPYTVTSITIYAGQRYSAVLNASQPTGNYWIRAIPIIDGLEGNNITTNGGINSAILRYSGASEDDPTSTDTSTSNAMVESKLVPYYSPAAPGQPDANSQSVHKVTLNFTLDVSNGKYTYALNGVNVGLPTVPILSQILQGATTSQLIPTNEFISLPANSVIQLTIPGGGPKPDTHHPIHLHGHNFSVIQAAGQTGPPNFVNPPRRDVVNMGTSADNVTIRFTTGNAGPWFIYDHNAFHMNAGFATVMIEDTPANIANKVHPPSQFQTLCNAWNAYTNDGGK